MGIRPPQPPDAFLSYTRFDDQHDGGKITEFCQRLAHAVQAVTGTPFRIFQDVGGIGVGEHWPGKLDEMLDEARFFIPVLTPSYFNSTACRDELQKFLRAEAERERNDLVLQIYYIESDILEDDDLRAADPLARTLHERQRYDWRKLRYSSFKTKGVRTALDDLAKEIVCARRRVMTASILQRPVEVTTASTAAVRPKPGADWWRKRAEERIRAVEEARSQATPEWWKQQVEELKQRVGVFRDVDAPWCPEMVEIPAGEFMMGSTEAERQWAIDQGAKREWVDREKPQHLVGIAYPLAVGRYPVTFEEYGHFARSMGRAQPGDASWGRGRRPVINVSWEDGKAYVEWLAAETGQAYRLLSEAEWEYACRAGTTTRYWWGDEITPENANYGRKVGKTDEVGSYPANPFRLYDTNGNVWEWVEDRWQGSYAGAPDDGSAWIAGTDSRRLLRGGSWVNGPGSLRSACRGGDVTDSRKYDVGFRVARTLTPHAILERRSRAERIAQLR